MNNKIAVSSQVGLNVVAGAVTAAVLPLLGLVNAVSAEVPPPMPEWQKLYVGEFARQGEIYEISHDGAVRIYAKVSAGAPQGLAFAPDGTLYCAAGEVIWKITPTTDGSTGTEKSGHVTRFAEGFRQAKALARDNDGNLWLTEYYLEKLPTKEGEKEQFVPGRLTKISPGGEKTIVESDLVWPYGLALGPDGDMYYASLGAMSVFRYPINGGEKVLVADKIYWCRNVAFDPSGNLYAFGGHGVTKITPDGQKSMFHTFEKEKGKNNHPVGLAFDANGTLYTSDVRTDKTDPAHTGTVYVYGNDGSRSVFARVGYSPFYMAFWPLQKPNAEVLTVKKQGAITR